MKTIQKKLAGLAFLFVSLLTSFLAAAQEKSTDVNIDINKDSGSNWYTQPWVWIVGAAVFILLLVALLRGSGRRSD